MSFWADGFWADGFWADDFWATGDPPVIADGYSGGTAVSSTGVMQTVFLGLVDPVPGTAVFLRGIAHNSAGHRYVCPIPLDGIVTYSAGRAIRPDGAQCIVEDDPDVYLAGFGYSNLGELCVTLTPGSNFVEGISVEAGRTAVSELS